MASQPDSEGYTADAPQTVMPRLSYWKDDEDRWVLHQDITALFKIGVQQTLSPANPIYHAFDLAAPVLKRLFDVSYEDQVTGRNADSKYWTIREKIRKGLADNAAVADVSGVWDYALTLAARGEFSGQLAARASGPRCVASAYQRDPDRGTILRVKYVVRENEVRFTAGLTLVGQLIDPFQIFSGGPAFKITFDILLTVDLELPPSAAVGACLLAAKAQNINVNVEGSNLDGKLVEPIVGPDIRKAVAGTELNVAAPIQQSIAPLNRALANLAFDRAQYHVDWSGVGFVVMDFTLTPWRQFKLFIDRIQENFVSRAFHGTVKTWALVGFDRPSLQRPANPDPLQDCFTGDAPAVKYYPFGLRHVTVRVFITRAVTPEAVKGHLRRLDDGSYEVRWEDGTIDYLPSDFDINQLPPSARSGDDLVKLLWPAVRDGLARHFDLRLDYATRQVSCTIEGQQITGTDGQSMHIPGDASKPEIWPDVWLTVTMEGTRTPAI